MTQCVRIKLMNEVNLIRILILLEREDLVSFRRSTTYVLDCWTQTNNKIKYQR